MRLAIAGAGVAGAYLSHRLSQKYTVEVFERKSAEDLGRNCAWGTNLSILRKYSKLCGLNPKHYILHVCKELLSDIYVNRDSVIVDKREFLLDLLEKSEAQVHFQKRARTSDLGNFDLVIDATGPSRALLPPPCAPSSGNWICPTFQVDLLSSELPTDLYFVPRGIGYLWVFPQGGNRAKVGYGGFDRNPKQEIEAFLAGKKYEEFYRTAGMVRMIPPSRSRPFFKLGTPPIFGVGESIGTVSPISGEGISCTLHCSDILLDALTSKENLRELALHYEENILNEFAWIDRQFTFINEVRFGDRCSQFWSLLKMSTPSYVAWDVSKVGLLTRPISKYFKRPTLNR